MSKHKPLSGRQLLKMAQEMFGTKNITQEQLAYVMDMSRPSTYALRHHKIKNRPLTFSVPSRDPEKARSHRPFQIDILDDPHPDIVVLKSRQLG